MLVMGFCSMSSLTPSPSEMVTPVHLSNQLVQDMNMSPGNSELRNFSTLPSNLRSPSAASVAVHPECTSPTAPSNLTASPSFPSAATNNDLMKNFPNASLDDSSNQANLLPSDAMAKQYQAIENILNWIPPSGSCENEQNIDNWLGQLIKADNLSAGASLPLNNGLGSSV